MNNATTAMMFQALEARAAESEKEKPFIYDGKAIEIVKAHKSEQDLSCRGAMGRGAMARMILLDRMVKKYIEANPQATIINLACGADTRFYRVDNGRITWYHLDLPQAIESRKELFGDEGARVFYIGKSAMDESWALEVEKAAKEGPVLVIAESLSMYLTKQEVQKIFKIIRMNFKQADVYIEITAPYIVKKAIEGSGDNSRSKYTFGVQNAKKLQEMVYGFKAVKCVTLMAGLRKMYPSYYFLQFMPALRRMSNKIAVLKRSDADPYKGMGIK